MELKKKYKIIVKGDANQDVVTDDLCDCGCICDCVVCGDVSDADEIECNDDFAEYIDNEIVKNKIVSGFAKFSVEDGLLYIITTYYADEELTQAELDYVKEYTQGQWSDGIGESFEQNKHNDLYISMWHQEQKMTITQEEVSDDE